MFSASMTIDPGEDMKALRNMRHRWAQGWADRISRNAPEPRGTTV